VVLGQSLSTATDKRSVMSESNVKIVRSLCDAFAHRDQPAMVQSLDPEVEVQQAEMPYPGLETVVPRNVLEHLDLRAEPRQFFGCGRFGRRHRPPQQAKAFGRKLRDTKSSLLSHILLRQRG
jgi:hypothetical protein